MRIFNRIVIVLLLAGLVALGISTLFYAFDLAGYRLADLPGALNLDGYYQGLNSFVGNVESGNLNPLDYLVLAVIALLGLVLLVLELKPPAPRLVRMERGTYITRSAVATEAEAAAEEGPEVLESDVDVAAQRSPGAKVSIRASIRRGENARALQASVRNRVQQRLARIGVPVSNLKVDVLESDPRQTRTRVK